MRSTLPLVTPPALPLSPFRWKGTIHLVGDSEIYTRAKSSPDTDRIWRERRQRYSMCFHVPTCKSFSKIAGNDNPFWKFAEWISIKTVTTYYVSIQIFHLQYCISETIDISMRRIVLRKCTDHELASDDYIKWYKKHPCFVARKKAKVNFVNAAAHNFPRTKFSAAFH